MASMDLSDFDPEEASRQTAAGLAKTRNAAASMLMSTKKLQAKIEARRKAEEAKKEALASQRARQKEEHDKEDEEDEPADADLALDGLADQDIEEEQHLQPVAWEPAVFAPATGYHPPLDLSTLSFLSADTQLPGSSAADEDTLFRALEQGLMVDLYGASEATLQLLYQGSTCILIGLAAAATHPHASRCLQVAIVRASQQAAEALLGHYSSLPLGTRPCWVPSLQCLLSSLQQLGYVSSVSQGASTKTPGRSKAQSAPAATTPGNAAPQATPGTAAPETGGLPAPDSQQQAVVLQQAASQLGVWLRLVTGLCELSQTRDLLDFSRQTKVVASQVLLALFELHLVPELRRRLLLDLDRCLQSYMETWAQADSSTWDTALKEVTGKLATAGGSHLSALTVLRQLSGDSAVCSRVQQEGLLALMAHLLGAKQGPQDRSRTALPIDHALRMLPPTPRSATQSPTARDLWAHFHKQGVPGIYQLSTVLQCVFLLLWPHVYHNSTGDDDCGKQRRSVLELLRNMKPLLKSRACLAETRLLEQCGSMIEHLDMDVHRILGVETEEAP